MPRQWPAMPNVRTWN